MRAGNARTRRYFPVKANRFANGFGLARCFACIGYFENDTRVVFENASHVTDRQSRSAFFGKVKKRQRVSFSWTVQAVNHST